MADSSSVDIESSESESEVTVSLLDRLKAIVCLKKIVLKINTKLGHNLGSNGYMVAA